MNEAGLIHLEKCKEQRLFDDHKHNVFLEYLQTICQASLDFVSEKSLFCNLIDYILCSQLK